MSGLRKKYWLVIVLLLSGCTALGTLQFENRYGKAVVKERVVGVLPAGAVDYWREVKPILEQRCVVCHGCYDAPCQLKMSSIEGIERGASEAQVYQSTRLTAAPTTRLFEDAHSLSEWRGKDFH